MKVSLIAIVFAFLLALGIPTTGYAGPLSGGGDLDGDTIENAFDNCSTIANVDQGDLDHSGCGNVCAINACDPTGDGIIGVPDFQLMVTQIGNDCSAAFPVREELCKSDCTNDGIVGIPDFTKLLGQIGDPASNFPGGPSGIANASCDPAVCDCTKTP